MKKANIAIILTENMTEGSIKRYFCSFLSHSTKLITFLVTEHPLLNQKSIKLEEKVVALCFILKSNEHYK